VRSPWDLPYRLPSFCDGTTWEQMTPLLDGNTYFIMRSAGVSRLPLITATNVRDDTLRAVILDFFELVHAQAQCDFDPSCHELVLELDVETGCTCHGYLVNHSKSTVFWHVDISVELSTELSFRETVSEKQNYLFREILYCQHVQLFPHRPLPREIQEAVRIHAAVYRAG